MFCKKNTTNNFQFSELHMFDKQKSIIQVYIMFLKWTRVMKLVSFSDGFIFIPPWEFL
jgi:predicted transcriptional regulator